MKERDPLIPKFDGAAHDAGKCGAIFYGSGQSVCSFDDGHDGNCSWHKESISRAPSPCENCEASASAARLLKKCRICNGSGGGGSGHLCQTCGGEGRI